MGKWRKRWKQKQSQGSIPDSLIWGVGIPSSTKCPSVTIPSIHCFSHQDDMNLLGILTFYSKKGQVLLLFFFLPIELSFIFGYSHHHFTAVGQVSRTLHTWDFIVVSKPYGSSGCQSVSTVCQISIGHNILQMTHGIFCPPCRLAAGNLNTCLRIWTGMANRASLPWIGCFEVIYTWI